ncbi:aspartyl-tRNA synthetase [Enteropsectra breve]|nr:aspartyl-tRNA synthetase [Enteropsectra breve]
MDLEKLSVSPLVELSKIEDSDIGSTIKTRGFVGVIRSTRYVKFITLRDQLDTMQCIAVVSKDSNEDPLHLNELSVESYVELCGLIKAVKTPIKSCTKSNFEMEIQTLKIVSAAKETLPFNLKDASATAKEREENPSICGVAYNLRLDKRFLDFRMPQTQAIVRVTDGVMNTFRKVLKDRDFTEIKTTKIIQSGSEGGCNLFSIDYFGKPAYLAQSPQLYKQMAIAGGLKRVFEIGHVYRAEVSNINRYLSEFTGMDIEMEMNGSYLDTVGFIYSVFVKIFDTLKSEYSRELEIIRAYRPFEDLKYGKEPVIITHHDAIDLLKKEGVEITYEDDFNREQENKLGAIVKELHGVDFFVVRDYPAAVRAFYTYVDPDTKASHSYDFILRGEEILSGAQRIVDYEALNLAIAERGIAPASLEFYTEMFKYGAPPHAGCGIGLERLLKAYFNFDDIRYFSLFPRDPNRCLP